jgi:hypothetical protein
MTIENAIAYKKSIYAIANMLEIYGSAYSYEKYAIADKKAATFLLPTRLAPDRSQSQLRRAASAPAKPGPAPAADEKARLAR